MDVVRLSCHFGGTKIRWNKISPIGSRYSIYGSVGIAEVNCWAWQKRTKRMKLEIAQRWQLLVYAEFTRKWMNATSRCDSLRIERKCGTNKSNNNINLNMNGKNMQKEWYEVKVMGWISCVNEATLNNMDMMWWTYNVKMMEEFIEWPGVGTSRHQIKSV